MKRSLFLSLLLTSLNPWSLSSAQNMSDRLFDKAVKVVIRDPDSAAVLSTKMLEESQNRKDHWNATRARVIEGMVAFQKNDLEFASKRLLQVVGEIQDLSRNSFEEGLVKNYLGRTFTRLNSMARAENYFREARDIFKKNDKIEYYCIATSNRGTILSMQGKHSEALTYYIEVQKLVDQGKASKKRLPAVLSNIAISYDLMGESDKALKYAFESLELEKKLENVKGVCQSYNSIGNILNVAGKLDSSLYYYNLSIRTAPDDNPRLVPVVRRALQNISGVYVKQGRLEEAVELLKKSQKTRSSQNLYQIEVVYNQIAEQEFNMQRYDSTIFYAHKALEIGQQNGLMAETKNASDILRKCYVRTQQHDSAYRYQSLYYAYHDSLYNESNRRKFNNLRIELETLEKQKEIDQLKQEQVIDKLNSRITTGSLATGVLFVLVIFGFYRNKQQSKQRSLERKLDLNQKQLTHHTLNMVHKNNGFTQMEDEVKKMRKEGEVNFQKLLNIISLNRSAEKDWDNFNNYFSAAHPGFEKNLISKFPDLSMGESRLASLIKIKLTNIEIACIMNIESKSARMNKYRLKRKLGLSEEMDLYDFMSRV